MPTRFSQVDHADEWASHGGETNQANGGIACAPHNVEKNRQRWRIRQATNGRTYTIREDGTIMLPVGARAPEFADAEASGDQDGAMPSDAVESIWQNMTQNIRLVDPIELSIASGR